MRQTFSRLLLGGAAAAALAVAACSDNRAISTEPIGIPVYGFQLIPANLIPRGTVRFAFVRNAGCTATSCTANLRGDTIQIDFAGLDSLENNGFYTVWRGDSLGTEAGWRRLPGTLFETRIDTTASPFGEPIPHPVTTSFPGISAFRNGGGLHRFQFLTNRTTAGLAATDTLHSILITIEDNATATTPNPRRRILWAFRSQASALAANPQPTTGALSRDASLRFGQLGVTGVAGTADIPRYVFQGVGRGRGLIRRNVMLINDSSLALPPLGYEYAIWLVKRDSFNLAIDTVYLGELTSPFNGRKTALHNADSVPVGGPNVDPRVISLDPPQILAASNRFQTDTIPGTPLGTGKESFRGFADLFITLELKNDPKLHQEMSPAIVLRGTLPLLVRLGP